MDRAALLASFVNVFYKNRTHFTKESGFIAHQLLLFDIGEHEALHSAAYLHLVGRMPEWKLSRR